MIQGIIGDKPERKKMNLMSWVNVLNIIIKIVARILQDTDSNGTPDILQGKEINEAKNNQ